MGTSGRTPARDGPRAGVLAEAWFARPAEEVARGLLGATLVSCIDGHETVGRIVETEAYIGPHDPASHAAERIGRTARNDAMFGRPGTAYVYRIYGVHWCLNVVTDQPDFPAAVLIRALEPTHGLDVMRARRSAGQKHLTDRALASGPGRLAAAIGVSGDHDGHPLDRPPLWLEAGGPSDAPIRSGPRIGVTRAADWPLRFWIADCPWVSRTRRI
ncbi:MAG TPA: DNA-3-methyladenine glycosylase [Longimicrobiales bacterium]|nr:DNA-3-methyladenine glycosylase [Longimicrobiales bacterium]